MVDAIRAQNSASCRILDAVARVHGSIHSAGGRIPRMDSWTQKSSRNVCLRKSSRDHAFTTVIGGHDCTYLKVHEEQAQACCNAPVSGDILSFHMKSYRLNGLSLQSIRLRTPSRSSEMSATNSYNRGMPFRVLASCLLDEEDFSQELNQWSKGIIFHLRKDGTRFPLLQTMSTREIHSGVELESNRTNNFIALPECFRCPRVQRTTALDTHAQLYLFRVTLSKLF